MQDKLFIFDLDGTIVKMDVSPRQLSGARSAINSRLRKAGIQLQYDLRPLIPKIVFLCKMIASDRARTKVAKDLFSIIDEMETHPDGGLRINQDNVDLLRTLREREAPIGLITNNGKIGVLKALSKIGLREDFFDFLITRDDTALPKPFADPYLKIDDYLGKYLCYVFSDDIFDFLPLIYLEKEHRWNVDKYLVLQMDIRNHSYNWETLARLNFDDILKEG
jgi:FMN phosphatase YigB (HAD superfamily)